MGEEKESWAELGIETSQFEALERDFQEVLQELVGDKSLARFREEYEKIHQTLQKSHANEKRLIAKCRALNAEIVTNAAKVQQTLKLSHEDQQTISQLKKEIEKAWKMVDTAHEKDKKATETITQLNEYIAKLTKLCEDGAGFSIGQENSVNELFKVKEDLQKEVDRQFRELQKKNAEMEDEREKYKQLFEAKQALFHEKKMMEDQLRTHKTDYDLSLNEKTKLEQEVETYKSKLEKRNREYKEKEQQLIDEEKEHDKILHDLGIEQQAVKQMRQEIDKAERKDKELSVELMRLYDACTQFNNMNRQLQEDKTSLEGEIERLGREIKAHRSAHNETQNKLKKTSADKESHERDIKTLKEERRQLKQAADAEAKLKRQAEGQVEALTSEKDRMRAKQQKEKQALENQQRAVSSLHTEKSGLENHINLYKEDAQKQRKSVHNLEKERDKFRNLTMELSTKLLQTEEEVKIKDLNIFDKKKKLREYKVKLKQQQMLYEAVRSDRNLYSKQFIEAHDEIAEYKRKFNMLMHEIDQLKGEVVVKEQAIFTEHRTHIAVQKQFANKQGQLAVLEGQIVEARKYSQSQEEEITKLKHIINEADTDRMRQKKALDAARNERDILGTQLIRRNDELALLYEKINIQKYTLEKGEKQYSERMKEIEALKNTVKDDQRELKLLNARAHHVESLKMAVYQLQRELLQERNRVKALSEELENPMNIHRWRKLEGTDPHKYELIRKIQTLQKRLIAKTEEVVEKELIIQQKDKYYQELKNILARQPGPEVAEQVATYQNTIKQKTAQLKSLASELQMTQAQIAEYTFENERIQRELAETKKRYFDLKKKDHNRKTKDREKEAMAITALPDPAAPRFAGGGFAIS